MVLVDSNIPMYLVGADHPLRDTARLILDDLVDREERLVTDAEVLQEILHRFVSIGRPDAIQPAFDLILEVVDEVLAITLADLEEAKHVVLGKFGVSARDAVHVAVMRTHGIRRILSFDSGLDRVPGIERISQ